MSTEEMLMGNADTKAAEGEAGEAEDEAELVEYHGTAQNGVIHKIIADQEYAEI